MVLTLEQVLESPRRLIKTTDGGTPALVFLNQKVWGGASNKFPGDADAAGPGTALRQPVAYCI